MKLKDYNIERDLGNHSVLITTLRISEKKAWHWIRHKQKHGVPKCVIVKVLHVSFL